jgi:50S ribosomal subunit-associated GTPase HflX
VYDVTEPKTFDSVATHSQRYLDACVELPLVVIAANKGDLLNDDTESERLARLHNSMGWQTFLVSAKTGEQVRELFEYCGEQVVDMNSMKVASESRLHNEDQRESKECC